MVRMEGPWSVLPRNVNVGLSCFHILTVEVKLTAHPQWGVAFAFHVKTPWLWDDPKVTNYYKTRRKCATIFPYFFCRWWNLNVSALNLNAPLTVHPDVSIQDTLKLLHREAFDQVPVVDESGWVQWVEVGGWAGTVHHDISTQDTLKLLHRETFD